MMSRSDSLESQRAAGVSRAAFLFMSAFLAEPQIPIAKGIFGESIRAAHLGH
jgi:hypothetical protein